MTALSIALGSIAAYKTAGRQLFPRATAKGKHFEVAFRGSRQLRFIWTPIRTGVKFSCSARHSVALSCSSVYAKSDRLFMGRLLHFLVIMLTLVGQQSPCECAGSREMQDRAARPHFHLGFGHAHCRGEATRSPAQDQTRYAADADCSGHDCDAIYFGELQVTQAQQKVGVSCASQAALPLIAPSLKPELPVARQLAAGPANSWLGTPLFLRTTSLRL